MSMDVFQAYLKGYSDHLFDLQLLGVQQGYWSGYYGRAKKPKNLNSVMEKLMRNRHKGSRQHAPDVDVEAFKAMEERFLQKLNQ